MSDEDAADIERERRHWLNQLKAIPARRQRLDLDERETVRQARFAGIGWDQIGEALGMPGIDARDKYGEPEGDPF